MFAQIGKTSTVLGWLVTWGKTDGGLEYVDAVVWLVSLV